MRTIDSVDNDELLTLSEAARLLKFNTKQLKEFLRSRNQKRRKHPVPTIKLHSKAIRIRRKDLLDWIEKQR
jgi:Helix-turn-helix domain